MPIAAADFEAALYWDLCEPYHYVRSAAIAGDASRVMLLVGGEDHRVGEQLASADDHYARLEAWARARWPSLGAVEWRWSGQIVEPADHVAYIGRNPGDFANVLVATGDSGNGFSHAAVAGLLLADLVQGVPNAWEGLYAPSRLPSLRSLPGVLAHDLRGAAAGYAGVLTRADVADIEDVPRCSGAIVRRGLRKYAVFRDERGVLHACSAVCPHMGAIVRWNPDEQSFDCPAYGAT